MSLELAPAFPAASRDLDDLLGEGDFRKANLLRIILAPLNLHDIHLFRLSGGNYA